MTNGKDTQEVNKKYFADLFTALNLPAEASQQVLEKLDEE
jgi:hypothetical protein